MNQFAKLAMIGAVLVSAPTAFAQGEAGQTPPTEPAITVVTIETIKPADGSGDAPMLLADEDAIAEASHAVAVAEAVDICEATCAGTADTDACTQACIEETTFCFERCSELDGDGGDCFITCTNIAVDFRQRFDDSEGPVDPRLAGLDGEPQAHHYGRKLAVGLNFRGYVYNVPNFALGIFLDRYISHWDDKAKFIYGGELLFRFDDRNDFIIGVDYADLRTPDGWWLEKNEDITGADWVHNDLRTVTISLEWNGIANLDKKKRAQIYGGVGLGAAIRLGDFRKNEMSMGCIPANATLDILDTMTPTSACPSAPGQDPVLDGSSAGEANDFEIMNIPPVLPSLIASVGFRYLIADTLSIGIEGGFKTAAFYGGIEVGLVFGKKHERSRPSEAP